LSKHVLIIGGGAAGLFAALTAAEAGARVTVVEKNKVAGRKLLITGKGRCNLTNAGTLDEIMANLPVNGAFLHSALRACSNADVVDTFNRLGLATKVERGDRVFPQSDRAADVVDALMQRLATLGVKFIYQTTVDALLIENNQVRGVMAGKEKILADAVIIATGGASYPGTGSTGDGYRLARQAGHLLVPLKPSLVPLVTKESWVPELQGLSLKNVRVTAWAGEKKIGEEFGEMLFTHFGVSGPLILSLSRVVVQALDSAGVQGVTLRINLKPALSPEQVDLRLQRDLEKFSRKQLANAFNELLPKSLIPVFVRLTGINPEKPAHQISREERLTICRLLQALTVTVLKPRPLAEAIITSGGVSTREVDPKTMASKRLTGLYFAGEILDVEGYTGGFNLQIAFSTGASAGLHAAG